MARGTHRPEIPEEFADYPRDMAGYGAKPPHPHWPGDARLALQFVINYEEGGENNILHGDPASEAFLTGDRRRPAPARACGNMNMESIYEYGSRAGFWRLHRLFTERHLPVTVYGVTMALARNPAAVEAMLTGRLGDRQPRLSLDRLSVHAGGDRARASGHRHRAAHAS